MVGSGHLNVLENVGVISYNMKLVDLPIHRTELGIGWYCDYDSYDLAALSLLSHGPPVGIFATLISNCL